MTAWADVIVIGGGIVGSAAARTLAGTGRRVLLVERGSGAGEATDASAGMLAAQSEAHAGDPLLPLALAGRDAWGRLLRELPLEVSVAIDCRTEGILRLAMDERAASELQSQVLAQRGLGLRAEWLDGDEVRRRHPGASPAVRGALLAPDDGCVNPVAAAAALRAGAFARGASIVTATATHLLMKKGHVTAVRTTAGTWRAPWVVLAAGAWSAAIDGLPRRLPVSPVRGQMLAVAAPDGWNRQVLFGPGAYVVPRADTALLGSTMEHTGFDCSTTDEGIAAVRAACERFLPALAAATELRRWAGLRPLTPDGLPILGFDPEVRGLVYATGHGRNGILLGPLTGEIIRDLVMHGETAVKLDPYSVVRFSEGAQR